jgi:hypothetical protein
MLRQDGRIGRGDVRLTTAFGVTKGIVGAAKATLAKMAAEKGRVLNLDMLAGLNGWLFKD